MNASYPRHKASNEERRDLLTVAIRAYVPVSTAHKPSGKRRKQRGPSEWTLVFDTETTTDASQQLRFGAFQLRKGETRHSAGLFYDASVLSLTEQQLVKKYATENDLSCTTVSEFVDDVFFGQAYELRANIVGFNLPFDISRLAVRHGFARGKMKGGFSFQLSSDPWKPRVQIKHLSSRMALIQFASTKQRRDNRRMRRDKREAPAVRGSFIDLKTIGAALLSQSFSLSSMASFLQLTCRKAETDDHGRKLTRAYLDYAVQDVEVTWQAFRALSVTFDEHDLSDARLSQILSEASLGKAYLWQMGIRPWRAMQLDFGPSIIGSIMSSYFGGRSEVHIRRTPVRVLYCDFLSMYPTVCTLMKLWRFVIAKGMTVRDTTKQTIAWLETVTPTDLQKPKAWQRLTTIVQLMPDDDVLPVRAQYGLEGATTIGLNYLASDQPLWFTLADCLASKFLTGKTPTIVKALTFSPGDPQEGLRSVSIGGAGGHTIDPLKDDFYKCLIDLRSRTKHRMNSAKGAERERLDGEQLATKILANATSYGIFIELNVEALDAKEKRECYSGADQPISIRTDKLENPGACFHPLLGTLITGAARLMLALTERAVKEAKLDWAFCDTDSMAIAKPNHMSEAEFLKTAKGVCDWFVPLNPYEKKGPLLKIEDINYRAGTGEILPLYCLAISAKRYALFNLDEDNRPIIRKASAHGLGHLTDPYPEDDAPPSIPAPIAKLSEIGVRRWQYDLWFKIIEAAYSDKPDRVRLDYHPAFNLPAVARYAATTPNLLKWFSKYNQGKPYGEQVKPFNFLLGLQAKPMIQRDWSEAILSDGDDLSTRSKRPKNLPIRPVSPYFQNAAEAAANCLDRESGAPVSPGALKTYRDALAFYHLSPELKFENGDRADVGTTNRRHVRATGSPRLIGKESNRWEEQNALGLDEELDIDYGFGVSSGNDPLADLMKYIMPMSERELARISGISRTTIRKSEREQKQQLRPATITKFNAAISRQNAKNQEIEQLRELAKAEIARIGISEFAKQLDCDPSNLLKMINGKRKITMAVIERCRHYFK